MFRKNQKHLQPSLISDISTIMDAQRKRLPESWAPVFFEYCFRQIDVLDDAPWHGAHIVRDKAEELDFQLLPLPGYSPDLNPIEGLWKWMREVVAQHHSYPTMRDLFLACKDFIDRINLDSHALVKRLWPKIELDLEFKNY